MGQGGTSAGSSYALPTMYGSDYHATGLAVGRHVAAFIEFAKIRPDLTFRVTRVGCGLAGFRMKKSHRCSVVHLELPNVRLPPQKLASTDGYACVLLYH